MRTAERARFLEALPRDECRGLLERMCDRQRRSLRTHWQLWAHEGQLAPGGDWDAWLIMAGRGFGKTRAGAEWVRAIAESQGEARIALVGASLAEARAVMVEGESGLLAIAAYRCRPRFEPSKRLLTWPTGAQATLYSAGEPEALRGPQHSHARWPIAERRLCQRSNRAAGRTVAPGRGGRNKHTPRRTHRWTVLVDRIRTGRHLDRTCRPYCRPRKGGMDLSCTPRRNANARPIDFAGNTVSGRLAKAASSRRGHWRFYN